MLELALEGDAPPFQFHSGVTLYPESGADMVWTAYDVMMADLAQNNAIWAEKAIG